MEKFKFFSEPPMEIHSMMEVSEIFRAGGRLSFRLPRKSKRRFVKHIKRLNKLEMKRHARRGVVSESIFRVHFAYVMLIWVLVSIDKNNLNHSLWTYSACIGEIATFQGENLNKLEFLVTYYGRGPNLNSNSIDPGVSSGFNWSEE